MAPATAVGHTRRRLTEAPLLAGAERLFLTRGYLAVTVEDIAAKGVCNLKANHWSSNLTK